MSTMGERIKVSREAKGLYQSQLANLIGVKSAAVISNWEKDINKPDAEKIVKLCEALNISASYLLDYKKDSGSLSSAEYDHIKKYRTLDEHGKEIVDSVLDIEHKRCMVIPSTPSAEVIQLPYLLQPASAGTGELADDETAGRIPVLRNVWTAKADYALRVHGDSMEPDIHDGDIVLVRSQPSVHVGDTGIFLHDNERYIKVFRETYLESLNPAYDDIQPNESTRCIGWVIGILEPEWVAK